MSTGAAVSGGLEVRQLSVVVLGQVFEESRTVDEVLETSSIFAGLDARDKGFLLKLILTSLRHRGQIEAILSTHLSKPLPRRSGSAALILLSAVAQLLFLETPAHAAIDMAVRTALDDRNAKHFAGLINAVLRKVATAGQQALDELDGEKLNTPPWLWNRWSRNYGKAMVRDIAGAHNVEPAIDIVVRSDPASWAQRLEAVLLPGGHIRLPLRAGSLRDLPGFEEGAWWVQDVAAGMPVRLLGDLGGKQVLDLGAAPGGKTLQMCAAGANVTAVDSSVLRLRRLQDNLARTGFKADVLNTSILDLDGLGPFDAVLLDSPCSATGTIRRHPELPYLKSESQIGGLALRQREMLLAAAGRVRLGGVLVYCSCSLEPEEGEDHVDWFLDNRPDFELRPIDAVGMNLPADSVHVGGWLRTLPCMSFGPVSGMDGFFAAVFCRKD